MKILLVVYFVLLGLKGFSFSHSEKKTNFNRADSIIKKVILKKEFAHYSNLKATAYLKNSLRLNKAPKRFLGKRVRKLLKIKTTDQPQILYLYESNSDLYFHHNGEIKENVKAYKDYGHYRHWEFTRAANLQLNFNEDYVVLEGLSDKKFVSPISKNAFNYYEFRLDESTIDSSGEEIDVIHILPKKTFAPTFSGFIYVNKKNMQVCKVSLHLGDNAGISFINDLLIEQNLIKIDDFYYPTQTMISYFGKNLGFDYSGTCIADFQYTKIADDSVFKKYEVLKIRDHRAFSPDTIDKIRPIPLTDLEKSTYREDDSLKMAQGEKNYLDSLDKATLKQRLYPLLFSTFKFRNTYRQYLLEMDAVAPSLFYNTVEGPGIKYGATFTKYRDKDGSYYSIRPEFRYGFKNKQFNSDISFSWLYSPYKRGIVNVSMGSTYRDLNPNGTLSSVYNSLNTLLFEQNFLKLFRKQYASISTGRELTNNLYISGGLEYARNVSVYNTYDYSLRNIRDRNFTSNNPLMPDVESKLFPDHRTLRFSTTLVYTFNHHYVTNEGIKMYEIPKNPRLLLTYKKGLPVLGTVADFNFIEFEAQQEKLEMGLWGYASFSLSAGKFFNSKVNYYPDWKHFSGNMALIFNSGLKSFHLLDFYAYSTDKEFIEGHWEHNFNTKFFGRVPLLRSLKLQELLGAAFLAQPDRGNYFEIYAGVKRMWFRADYALSFDNDGLLNNGFKISFRL